MNLKVRRTDQFGRQNDWTLRGRFPDQAIRSLGQQMAIAKIGFFKAQRATWHGPTYPHRDSLLVPALNGQPFLRPLTPPSQPQETSQQRALDLVP